MSRCSSFHRRRNGSNRRQTARAASAAFALLAVCLCGEIRSAAGAGVRGTMSGSEADVLAKYFERDKQGRTIFDYAAMGTVPDTTDPAGPAIKINDAENANPGSESTQEASAASVLHRMQTLQQWFSGRKVVDDCPTFPYCNHIPAPPPVMPAPHDIEAPNSNIWYPWMPRFPSGADHASRDLARRWHSRTSGNELYHPWRKHQDVGRRWRYDPVWELPFERPGVVDPLYNREFQMHMYSPNAGAVVAPLDSRAPKAEPKPGGGGEGGDAAGSEAAAEDLSKSKDSIAKAGLATVYGAAHLTKHGPGMRPEAQVGTTGYQPPNAPNQAWDGVMPEVAPAPAPAPAPAALR